MKRLALTIVFALLFSLFGQFDSPALAKGGVRCSAGDGDPIKCMACAMYMEARGGGTGAMIAVGRNIKTRYESGRYPKNICAIVHQVVNKKAQYAPGVRNGYASESRAWARAMAAARVAIKMRGNGYLGFRTCGSKGASGPNKGGNCYTHTARADGSDEDGSYNSGPDPKDSSEPNRAPASDYAEAAVGGSMS